MYTFTPKPNRRSAFFISAVCFFTSFALFVPYTFEDWLVIFLRGLGTALFIIGFAVIDRYAFTSFSYSVGESEGVSGRLDFTVTSLRYGRQRTVCRVYVDEIIEIVPCVDAKKYPRDVKKYDYCPNFKGKGGYIVRIGGEDNAAIRIAPDETMVNLIKNTTNRK